MFTGGQPWQSLLRFSSVSTVHKDSIAVAHAQGQSADPPVYVGAIGTRQADLAKLIRRLQAKTATLVFAYEAGPCGYGLSRDLTGQDSTARWSPRRSSRSPATR